MNHYRNVTPTLFLMILLLMTTIMNQRIDAWSFQAAMVPLPRRAILQSIALLSLPTTALAKCTDIESCRDIGERKVEQDMKLNPVINLGQGLRYKLIHPGFGTMTVGDKSQVDLIFSITQANGAYMYSRGFGFEKINVSGTMQSDAGLDSLKIIMGTKDVPLGIERAIVGMKKGERRRVELPPTLGFDTSEGRPEPTTRRGKAQMVGYKQLLKGNGSTQPGFPAPTIWDVEVLSIK